MAGSDLCFRKIILAALQKEDSRDKNEPERCGRFKYAELKPPCSPLNLPLNHVFFRPIRAHPPSKLLELQNLGSALPPSVSPLPFSSSLALDRETIKFLFILSAKTCMNLSCIFPSSHLGAGPRHPCQVSHNNFLSEQDILR